MIDEDNHRVSICITFETSPQFGPGTHALVVIYPLIVGTAESCAMAKQRLRNRWSRNYGKACRIAEGGDNGVFEMREGQIIRRE